MNHLHLSLSLIIPCYNEEALLTLCVERILRQAQELGPRGEIIISVNGSTDATLQIAKTLQSSNPLIRVNSIPEANKKAAMNAGLALASNRYVVFCDADSFLDDTALLQLKTKITTNRFAIVGAIRRPLVNKSQINTHFLDTYFLLHYAKRLSLRSKERLSVQGWLMAIDTAQFQTLQFPLDSSADDIWLSAYTWTMHGAGSIGYIPHAVGTYLIPQTMEDLKSQLLRHRSNHKTVKRLHPELSEYFEARMAYYGEAFSTTLWRRKAIELGVDFDTWFPEYKSFTDSIDKHIFKGTLAYGVGVTWERVSSTKTLPSEKYIQ